MLVSTALTTGGRSPGRTRLRRVLRRVLCGVVALVGSCLALVVTAPPAHAHCGQGSFVFTATAANTMITCNRRPRIVAPPMIPGTSSAMGIKAGSPYLTFNNPNALIGNTWISPLYKLTT